MHLLYITSCVVLFGGTLVSSNCPVGTFDTWSAWDRCSASCGGGIQKRQQSLCCPPDAHGQWSDCRATYNITEKFKFDQKPCNQICAHGTFIAGGCRCDPGYNDVCCITRQTMASTQTDIGVLATTSSTTNATVTSRPSATNEPRAPSIDTTTETTAFRMSANTVTTSPNISSTTVTTQSSTSSTTVTTSPITNLNTITTEPRTSTTRVTTPNTSTTTVTTPNTSTTTVTTLSTKFGDDCTSTTCSSLMVCKNLSRGGHQCECKKLGNTDICVYVLIIILGSVMVGMAALITTIIIVRKKSKISPDKADVTEVGETMAVKN